MPIEVSPTTLVGYLLLDAELRVLNCNRAYLDLVRMERDQVVGRGFAALLPGAETALELLRKVHETGYVIRVRGYPYTFTHWHEWEQRHYDLYVHLLGVPGAVGAQLLVRITEAVANEKVEPLGVTSLLERLRKHKTTPLLSGEDSEGRQIDVYMHPAQPLSGRVALLFVRRDAHESFTLEFDNELFGKLALANVLHGSKS